MLALPETLTGHQSYYSLDGVGWLRRAPRFVLIEPPPRGGYWRQSGRMRERDMLHVCYVPIGDATWGISWWQSIEVDVDARL